MERALDRLWLRRAVGGLGVAAGLGMFLVLVLGETVTATGSAQGCGRDWPLCRGQLIPQFELATYIEYTHRVATGVVGILILALAAAALILWRDRRPVRVLAPLMLAALFVQAGMGAWAVKYPQSALVLALHFGFSLLALASAVLTAVYALQADRPGAFPERPAPRPLRRLTWGVAIYVYLLVYSGAYIRHAAAAAACPGWPLCGPSPLATPEGLVVNLLHRAGAGLLLLGGVGLLVAYRRLAPERRDLARGGWLLLGCLVAQGLSGAYLVWSGWALTGELLHAAVTGLTFTAVAYLCYRVLLGAAVRREVAPPVRLSAEGVP